MNERICNVDECTNSLAGRAPGAKYCSRRCKWTAANRKRRAVRIQSLPSCLQCGQDLTNLPGKYKFCSRDCGQLYGQRQRAGYIHNPACQDCGVPVTRVEGKRAPQRCHECQNIRSNSTRDRIKYRTRARERYHTDLEYQARERERSRASGIRRYHENPKTRDRILAYNKSRLEITRDQARQRYATDPEYRAAKIAAASEFVPLRRARKKGQLGKVSRGIKSRLLHLQGKRCAAPGCGKRIGKVAQGKPDYHLDHIIPMAKGGLHEDANLQILCAFCNMSKNAKDPLVFARERGMLL